MYDEQSLTLLPGWTDVLPERDEKKQCPYFPNENMNPETMRRILACYYACISHMDYWIGEMIQTLKDKGLYENTLIIYTADHGDYMGFHHMLLKQNYMYDPVMRVPLIVKRPYEQHAGETEKCLVSGADIASSILQWVGLDHEHVEGRTMDDSRRKWIISEQRMNGKWEYMLRSHRFKVLLGMHETLLYDLKNDPFEFCDIAEEHPEIISEAKDALYCWLAFSNSRHAYLDESAPQIRNEQQKARNAETVIKYYEKTFKADALE